MKIRLRDPKKPVDCFSDKIKMMKVTPAELQRRRRLIRLLRKINQQIELALQKNLITPEQIESMEERAEIIQRLIGPGGLSKDRTP